MSRRRGPALPPLKNSLSFTHNSTKLLDYCYLGGQEATNERPTLEMLGITHILNVSKECECHFPDLYIYLQLPIADDPEEDATPYFEHAHIFLENVKRKGQVALVHCQTGMSRSTTMVLAHLLKGSTMSLREALTFVKERRPRASPNAGFMKQLIDLEVELRGSRSIDLEKYRMDRFGEVDTYSLPAGLERK